MSELSPSTGPGLFPDAPAPVRIVGMGTAVPTRSYSQRELLEEFGIEDRKVRSLFLNSAIERRHVILPPASADGRRLPETQGELLRKHRTAGLDLGARAVADCLADAGLSIGDVRQVCCVSSTGFLAPGFSALLGKSLGLPTECARLDVVGMGCHAGLNGLNAVTAWSRANGGAPALLVCIEICSAAYVVDGTMRTAVVNSLFGDGAAAALVRHDREQDAVLPEVLAFSSCLIPQASAAMRFDWNDDQGRFSFYLDPAIPYVVGAHAERAVDRLLALGGLPRSRIDHWIVHSGGKKVIDAVRVNLGLSRHDVRHTTGVLRDFGNLSSGSFLFSFQRLRAEGVVRPGDVGVLMTMGPGSTIELALVRWGAARRQEEAS